MVIPPAFVMVLAVGWSTGALVGFSAVGWSLGALVGFSDGMGVIPVGAPVVHQLPLHAKQFA